MLYLQRGRQIQCTVNTLWVAQVEMGRLAVTERTSGALCSIVGRLPFRVAQELTQVLELGGIHLFLGVPQL